LLGLLMLFRQENLGFRLGSRAPPNLHPSAPLPRDPPPVLGCQTRELEAVLVAAMAAALGHL